MADLNGELRKMCCDMGTHSRSDGSAIYTAGETCVVATVNGPCATNHKKLSIDEAVVEVSYRPKIGQTCVQDKVTERILTKISQASILTTQYPRTVISIFVQEMQDCGGLLACSINALCIALMNSGLPMKFLFAAVCCIIDDKDNIIVDPDHKQLKSSKAVFTLTLEGKGNIVSSDITGIYTQQQFCAVVIKCQAASAQILQFYRDIVKKYSDRIAL